MSSQNLLRETGSTPPVGSSRNTTRGRWKIAMENDNFCFHPSGSDFTKVCFSGRKSSCSSISSVREGISLEPMP